MTYAEIGSYFWLEETAKTDPSGKITWLPEKVRDAAFTFSGRASIELALRDVLSRRNVRKVYAPSYCCISMVQPFLDHGLELRYYDVTFEDGAFRYDIDFDHDCDIVLIMNYFGFAVEKTHEVIEKLHTGGAVIIEDITHSLLSRPAYSTGSDYLVASLRKWFAVPAGGWLGKMNGPLGVRPYLSGNHAVDEKLRGMREKALYIAGKGGGKEKYLLHNGNFERDLADADRMLMIDDTSRGLLCGTDVERIRRRRRQNAETLLRGLKELDGPAVAVPEGRSENDTPLFVPIFMERADRDALRRLLTADDIYCPVHWPELPGAPGGIRENELSLICDQRYSGEDMEAILRVIRRWGN